MSIIFLYGFFPGLLIQWENTKEKGMRKVGGEREKGRPDYLGESLNGRENMARRKEKLSLIHI